MVMTLIEDGATIVNTDADTLTITEATTAFGGTVTISGDLTVGGTTTTIQTDNTVDKV